MRPNGAREAVRLQPGLAEKGPRPFFRLNSGISRLVYRCHSARDASRAAVRRRHGMSEEVNRPDLV